MLAKAHYDCYTIASDGKDKIRSNYKSFILAMKKTKSVVATENRKNVLFCDVITKNVSNF
ncbi:hypothetical protein LEP1GSC062_1027 [Leptospira alexanderi serovar Manhao 3 str. L 60]|uniref:Uncharacterized protein n=1 Tax=Leptospira alexanderi serovar Manhao 3 str. L 60 TaxID=1049759 RepID=V6HXX8_9LEPT|nr:hypothetical protein LEP1GSC062_1027 [Leptospira alexanderi serovar Manhao 3 str. L 60]